MPNLNSLIRGRVWDVARTIGEILVFLLWASGKSK
jgi:hypothetical protein